MEIVYAVDLKLTNDGDDFKQILTMDISCLNILCFSCSYLPGSNQVKYYSQPMSLTLNRTTRSSFCVYICALEQPWYCSLIATSNVPIVQLVWSLDGTHLLICNQKGICRIFQMKKGCINTMEDIYQYETNEDILCAKYIFPRDSVIVNLDRDESIFYAKEKTQSPLLQYALSSGNFICVTSSGMIHTLPVDRLVSPSSYNLSQKGLLCVSLCDIFPTVEGFNVILSERIQGALVHFFVVHDIPKLSYQARGFRIPSCYGKLQSLNYFQRNGIDCILTYMTSFSGDLIDLYEYNTEQEDWISITLLNSPQARISSISLSPNQFLIRDNDYQGLFGRQILVALSDGSIVCFDKLNHKCREQCFIIDNADPSEYFVRIQHTYSGSCCIGFTQTGTLVLLRTINLNYISSLPSITNIFVHLFEQYIVQTPCPCDIWDILCLIPTNSLINQIIGRLVTNYQVQTLELKRIYFTRFKECLYHLHRLAYPYAKDTCEHLISLLIYHVLLIVRDYLRLFIYEPTNRDFVDVAQEILQQPSFSQHIDIKRIKYVGDQSMPNNTNQYELIPFTILVDWISDIIFYLIGYLQSQQIPQWLTFEKLFTDLIQLNWLREFVIYFDILNILNRIPYSKIAHLQSFSQKSTNSNQQSDVLKDIYHSLTKFSRKIEVQKNNIFDESFLEDFSIFGIEMFQSKVNNMFPKSYRSLIPNLSLPQVFVRDQLPSFVTHTYPNPITIDNDSDTQFDIITLGKMSLSSNSTYRRCLRCSNFSEVFLTPPYPFLVHRLNGKCLCGGLFLLYTNEVSTVNITK